MDFTFLSKTELFRGASPEEIEEMLTCLSALQKHYAKGAVIYRAGEPARALGLVLAGKVTMEHDDVWGMKSILGHAGPGQIFAETYASIPGEPMMVNAVAAEPADILFLQLSRILRPCAFACSYHNRLVENLLKVTAEKNLGLSRRILHTAPKTIRARALSYLSFEATRQGGMTIEIPYDRQQLADYLGVDRSALSAELSKMQRDGLLTVHKNVFTLASHLPAD